MMMLGRVNHLRGDHFRGNELDIERVPVVFIVDYR